MLANLPLPTELADREETDDDASDSDAATAGTTLQPNYVCSHCFVLECFFGGSALMCIQLGETDFESAERTIDLLGGANRLVGSVTLDLKS